MPESQSALLRPGSEVEARSPAMPGTTFNGTVQAILPEVNPATRTLKARVELANPGTRSSCPACSSTINSATRARKEIVTGADRSGDPDRQAQRRDACRGRRQVRPVEVEIGIESDGQTEIRKACRPARKSSCRRNS